MPWLLLHTSIEVWNKGEVIVEAYRCEYGSLTCMEMAKAHVTCRRAVDVYNLGAQLSVCLCPHLSPYQSLSREHCACAACTW